MTAPPIGDEYADFFLVQAISRIARPLHKSRQASRWSLAGSGRARAARPVRPNAGRRQGVVVACQLIDHAGQNSRCTAHPPDADSAGPGDPVEGGLADHGHVDQQARLAAVRGEHEVLPLPRGPGSREDRGTGNGGAEVGLAQIERPSGGAGSCRQYRRPALA